MTYKEAADTLGVELAAIKAVAEVESSGSGFLNTGEPAILFEPHIYWKELVKRGINPEDHVKGNEDILYQKWGSKPYGPSSAQHQRLERATKINREAALSSASWGKFQILATNFRLCDCDSVQEFINAMYKDEGEHLRLFCNFLKNTGLVKHLKNKDWEAFARGYNGPSYAKNNYHKKLNASYIKHKV
jgi:hypothetical protein